jgi:hypothetical protein
MNTKDDEIIVSATVTEALPNAMFRVRVKDQEAEMVAYLSGKMKLHRIQRDLLLNFRQFYVPTRLNFSRRLSRDIFEWYLKHIPDCLNFAIREHSQGEEATAMHLSVPEYQPGSAASLEMNQFIKSIWLPNLSADKTSLNFTKSTNTAHRTTPESSL